MVGKFGVSGFVSIIILACIPQWSTSQPSYSEGDSTDQLFTSHHDPFVPHYQNPSSSKQQTVIMLDSGPKPVPTFLIDNIKSTWIPYAQSAFCTDNLTDWSCSTCTNNTRGTQNITQFGGQRFAVAGYSAVNPLLNTIIVAFRGTRKLDDWIADLLIAKPDLDYPGSPEGAKIHYGFLVLWEAVREVVLAQLKELLLAFPGYHTTFVGHSMGGAVSSIAAVDAVQSMPDLMTPKHVGVITFGQPRVGNAIYAEWVASLQFRHVYRIVNQDDLTPHLPPAFAGFQHYPHELWIADTNGTTLLCDVDSGDGRDSEEEGGDDDDGLSRQSLKLDIEMDRDDDDGIGDLKRVRTRQGEGQQRQHPSLSLLLLLDESPDCANRAKWRYNVSQHRWFWGHQIGSSQCVQPPTKPVMEGR